ncbi:hypothetical protein HPP92_019113 [Vanilla planifolia]|uniref:GYF domain-containing protein n=1 Tax=Vanilla planifolia TaxID=51239 RepID=A0A835UJ12_VANPL|nr:hypothetical protein HPP92_019113 [Vanilla planifolia]
MEGSSLSANSNIDISRSYGSGIMTGHDSNNGVYAQQSYVSGWMYMNENGQLCGPYTQQQLDEGLSTGFLPEELLVYPLINGTLINPVHLKYSKHLTNAYWPVNSITMASSSSIDLTAFFSASLQHGAPSILPSLYKQNELMQNSREHSSATCAAQPVESENAKGGITDHNTLRTSRLSVLISSEESNWMFEDEEGRKHGPHSFAELYYWHSSSYLQDSLMIHHIDNKCGPFTLLTLVEEWSRIQNVSEADADSSTGSFSSIISGASEDVSVLLHCMILKAARRVFLDEIISTIIPEFSASRKAQRSLRKEAAGKAGKHSRLVGKEAKTVNEKKKSSAACDRSVDSFPMMNKSKSASLSPVGCQTGVASVVTIDCFSELLLEIYKTLYYDCMKVLWSNVLFECVSDFLIKWLQMKCWDSHHTLPSTSIFNDNDIKYVDEFPQRTLKADEVVFSLSQSSNHEVDFPPGFEPDIGGIEMPDCLPSNISQSGIVEAKGINVYDADILSSSIKDIERHLESEVYLSAKITLFEYFEDVLKVEITKVLYQEAEAKTNEESIPKDSVCKPVDECLSSQEVDIEHVEHITQEIVDQSISHCSFDIFNTSNIVSEHVESPGPVSSLSSLIANAFERMGPPMTYILADDCVEEPPPPGLEIGAIASSNLFENKKIRPLHSNNNISTISIYVALAICRQKLHDEFIKEWEASYHSNFLQESINSWHALTNKDDGFGVIYGGEMSNDLMKGKHNDAPEDVLKSPEMLGKGIKSLEHMKNSRPSSILFDGNLTYFRKKSKLAKKKFGTVFERSDFFKQVDEIVGDKEQCKGTAHLTGTRHAHAVSEDLGIMENNLTEVLSSPAGEQNKDSDVHASSTSKKRLLD